MRYAVTSKTMKESEALAIGKGSSSIELMNRAAVFLLENINTTLNTAIVCGGGNNGGDGVCLACNMFKLNKNIAVILVGEPKTDNLKFYLNLAKKEGVNISSYQENTNFSHYEQIIDCIFGVGLNKEPMGKYAEVIDKINTANKIVISADIPSGLNADNGIAYFHTVKANKTVSFGGYKVGQFLNDAKDYVGELVNDDIGIELLEPKYPIYEKIDFKRFFPVRKENTYKYNNGKLTIIGGSKNFVGAVLMASQAEASLRIGSGLSTIAVPNFLTDSVRNRIVDQTLYPLLDDGETLIFNQPQIENLLRKTTAVAIGIGIGLSVEIEKLITYLLGLDIELLIDADGINVLSRIKEKLKDKKAKVIITPHTAEFSRLTGLGVSDILANPILYTKNFSKEYRVTVLLKGATSIITDGNSVVLSPYGNSSLSVGGSGDVLSGIIGGLLARGIDGLNAGVVGGYLLGRAGEKLSDKLTYYGVLASDIPKVLPFVIKEILD